MKLHGKKIENPHYEIVVLPRGGGNDLVFKAQAIIDSDPFTKLCPVPQPPKGMRPGGAVFLKLEDPAYKEAINQYARLKTAWTILESLRATPGLEWETVDYQNCDTWLNYESELKNSGLSEAEVQRLIQAVLDANALNETKMNEARERFLLGEQEATAQLLFPTDGPSTTPSGEPARDSA